MYEERKFDTGEILMHYAEGPPAGPPIILIHGVPGHWQKFLPIFPDLIDSYHLHAVDLRGHGKSGRTPGEYHSSFYAQDLILFIKHKIQCPTLLFGMSAGGLISIDATSQIPEMVKSLILGDAPIDMEWLISWMTSEEFIALFSAFRSLASSTRTISQMENAIANIQIPGQVPPVHYRDLPGIDSVHLGQLARVLSKLDPDVLEYHAEGRAVEYLQGFDVDKLYEMIKCPTLLIQGNPSLGGKMTDRSVELALSKLDDGYHVFLDNFGHDLGLEKGNTEPLLTELKAFLDSF